MRPVALLLLVACNSSSTSSSSSSAAPAAKSKLEGDLPVGVWLGLGEQINLDHPLLTDLKLQTIVVWPDGRFAYNAPWAGLADLDTAAWARDVRTNASLGGRPGMWKASDDGWTIAYDDGGSAKLGRDGDKLVLARGKLARLKDLTGATLDGTYTWWSKPEDPLLGGSGCQPLVTFTKDGKFDDRGGFIVSCLATDANAPGTGTYELRDFSLIMHYADGRVRHHLILPPGGVDLHADDSHAMIMGRLWQRRTSAIPAAQPIAPTVPTAPPLPAAPPPAPVVVETTTFDAVTFATPPGKMQRAEAGMMFDAGGCLTVMAAGIESSGTPAGDFAAAWKDLVGGDTTPTAQQGTTPSGLTFVGGGGPAPGGTRALFVFEVGKQQLRVVFAAPTEAALAACKPESLIQSIKAN